MAVNKEKRGPEITIFFMFQNEHSTELKAQPEAFHR